MNELQYTDEKGFTFITSPVEYDPEDDYLNFLDMFDPAIKLMAETYAKHREEKGDSWKEMAPEETIHLMRTQLVEWQQKRKNCTIEELNDQTADMLNVGFMLLMKLLEEVGS